MVNFEMLKKRLKYFILLWIVLAFLTASCKETGEKEAHPNISEGEVTRRMMEINRYLVKRNYELIENFVRRAGWNMTKTETGLWYMILESGTGKHPGPGDVVKTAIKIHLLDGTPVDGADRKEFIIGAEDVENGIAEGILLMKEGGRAIFILPPHLANGNFGNNRKIPPGSILVYEIELLNIIPSKTF